MKQGNSLPPNKQDTLAALRDQFYLPPNKVYLDGNSLGPLLKCVESRLQKTVRQEWGQDLIASWNSHSWIDLPVKVAEKIAPLVGAAKDQVICADSVSVNLFKLLVTALQLNPERTRVLSVEETFPTDLYMAHGLQTLLGASRCTLSRVSEASLAEEINDRTNLIMFSHVNFRSGYVNDLKMLTETAHRHGAMVLVDLSHSAGVMPIELDALGVDFAVGCGYKFLNGGPGAPAFLYVNKRHQNKVEQPLSGWMGHQSPFEFSPDYTPRAGIAQYQSGTPGIIGLSALDEAMTLWADISIQDVRQKSSALTSLFIDKVQNAAELSDLDIVSPLDAEVRASQVSLSHPAGYEIVQALIASGVICDYREPEVLRFGFAPLYNSFEDVTKAVDALIDIVKNKRYRNPAYGDRNDVT